MTNDPLLEMIFEHLDSCETRAERLDFLGDLRREIEALMMAEHQVHK